MSSTNGFQVAHGATVHSSGAGAYFELSTLPPTTNRLFFNAPGKGRSRTAKYKQWRHTAGWELKLQRVKPFAVPVRIAITLPDGPGRAPDIDNTAKALIDLLVGHQIIKSDHKSVLRELWLRWERDTDVVGVRIVATALEGATPTGEESE